MFTCRRTNKKVKSKTLRMSSNNEVAENYAKFSSIVQGECLEILLSKATVKPGGYCLDIGCGTGNVTAFVAKKVGPHGQVIGVDPDKHRIKVAQRNHPWKNMKFLEGKLPEVDLEESSFDLVFTNFVYQWLSEEECRKTTEKAFSVLKPNGLFLLAVPKEHLENAKIMLPYFPKEKQQHIFGRVSLLRDQYYAELFTKTGFEVVSFGAEVTETAFPSVEPYLQWMDASYDLKEGFKKVYYENENKIKFPRYADGAIRQKVSVLFAVFRKP